MGESFTRVAGDPAVGISVLGITLCVLLVGSPILKLTQGRQPYALMCFTAGLSILGLSSIPRATWINREMVAVCVLSLVVFACQMNSRDRGIKKLKSAFIPIVPLFLLAGSFDHPNSNSNVCVHRSMITFRNGGVAHVISDASASAYSDAGGLNVTSSDGHTFEVHYRDSYRDELGNRLSGVEVAARVEQWMRVAAHAAAKNKVATSKPLPRHPTVSSQAG